jgi:threonine synthase
MHDLKEVKQTSSPSIDIQISSNFERLLYDITQDHSYVMGLMKELKHHNSYTIKPEILKKIRNSFCSYSVSQEEVIKTIKEFYDYSNIVIDPHTAVGLKSSRKCSSAYDLYVTLSTAHPAKFKDAVSNIVKNESYIPAKIKDILNLEEKMIILENDMLSVKHFITKNI